MAPADLERAVKFAGVAGLAVKRCVEPVSRLPILKLDLNSVNAISLSLTLSRSNPARLSQGGIRIFAPRYPKPQTEGYFVILSYSSTDEIIALKRISWSDPKRSTHAHASAAGRPNERNTSSKLQATARISLPPEAQGKKVDVRVFSDAYLGMKWQIEGIDVPEAPRVDHLGKEKEKA